MGQAPQLVKQVDAPPPFHSAAKVWGCGVGGAQAEVCAAPVPLRFPPCRHRKALREAQSRLEALPPVTCIVGEPEIEDYYRLFQNWQSHNKHIQVCTPLPRPAPPPKFWDVGETRRPVWPKASFVMYRVCHSHVSSLIWVLPIQTRERFAVVCRCLIHPPAPSCNSCALVQDTAG